MSVTQDSTDASSSIPEANPRNVRFALIPEQYTPWLAGLCCLLAFFLRVYGVRYGLPYLYYWDEPTVVNRAVRFSTGDLNPHFFYYPALYMYALFVVCGLYFVTGRLTGHFHSPQDFAAEYFLDPTGVYMWARVTTALIGAATIWLTYQVGKKFFGSQIGLLGALFLTFSVLHVSNSHIAITDVPHGFFIIAALLPIHNIWLRGRRRDYLLAGLLIGLGTATKYLAALLVLSLLLAHLMQNRGESDPKRSLLLRLFSPEIVLAFVSVFLGFFIGSPYNLLKFREFIADYRTQQSLSSGEGGTSVLYFLKTILPGDFGWPLLAMALAGVVWLLIQRRRENLLFFSFPVVYFLFIARFPKAFGRYMIPEDPFLALAAGYALYTIFQRLNAWRASRLLPLAFAASLALLLAAPATTLYRWDSMMGHATDTRTLATNWANENIPSGASVAIQPLYGRTFFNAPLLTDTKLQKLDRDLPRKGKFMAVRKRIFDTLNARPNYREAEWKPDLTALKQSGASYLFLSDANGKLPARFADQLQTGARLVNQSSPDPVLALIPDEVVTIMPPTIRIYQIL